MEVTTTNVQAKNKKKNNKKKKTRKSSTDNYENVSNCLWTALLSSVVYAAKVIASNPSKWLRSSR